MFDCCAVREPASARMLQPGDGGDSRRGVGSQQTPKKRSVRLAAPGPPLTLSLIGVADPRRTPNRFHWFQGDGLRWRRGVVRIAPHSA